MKKQLSLIEKRAKEEDPLLNIAETCINDLTGTFFSALYLFYTENDLHCYLYKLLSEQLADAGYGL